MKDKTSVDTNSGAKDEMEGASKVLAGRVKEGLGKAVGSHRLEGSGKAEQSEGAVQQKLGEIKKVFDM